MRWIIALICLAAAPHAWADSNNVTLTWQPHPSWLQADGSTYLELPVESVTAARRLAVRVFADRQIVGEVWDDPIHREVNVSVPMEGSTVHIAAQAVAYECGPWRANTAVAAGDKICVGPYPSTYYAMVASAAGTTGSAPPVWPVKRSIPVAHDQHIAAFAAVDLGDGIVGIPVHVLHPYRTGDRITLTDTVNYDGTHVVHGGEGQPMVMITATYVAETFTGAETIAMADSAVIDNGDGTVRMPCPGHGFMAAQNVTVSGTKHYNGTYTLGTQTDPNWLTITAAYTAEVLQGGHAVAATVSDGTAVWRFTDFTGVNTMAVLESDQTRRIVARSVDGSLTTSAPRGVRFGKRVP